MSNYPLGANDCPYAPWKGCDYESEEVEVVVNVELCKKMTLYTDAYSLVDDFDGENECCRVEFTKNDFTEEYEEQEISLKEVLAGIELAKKELEDGLSGKALRRLQILAEAAKGWEVADVYVEKDE